MSPITVTLSAPSTGERGQAFTVSGYVFEGPNPRPGVTVTIYQGGTSKGTALTYGSGLYSKSITINQEGTFPIFANALDTWSNIEYITITKPEPEPEPTLEATLNGIVTPAKAGFRVYIQREIFPGTWVDYGSKYTDANGHVTFVMDAPAWSETPWTYRMNILSGQIVDGVTYGGYISGTAQVWDGSEMDLYLNPEPVVTEPYTVIDDFVVPDSLPEGSDVNVRILLRNAGGASGYLTVTIIGNPYDPDSYTGVEAVRSPTQVAPGSSVWLDIYFRFNKMPGWDFNLTVTNYDETSQINRIILVGEVPVGIHTTTTLVAPDKAGVGEKFHISGILYETDTGVPIPNMPISHSYNGRSLGSSTTGVDGDYLKEVSVPESGTWTLRSDFPGTEALQASRSQADTVVAATPVATALQIAGSIVTGLALFIYGTS